MPRTHRRHSSRVGSLHSLLMPSLLLLLTGCARTAAQPEPSPAPVIIVSIDPLEVESGRVSGVFCEK